MSGHQPTFQVNHLCGYACARPMTRRCIQMNWEAVGATAEAFGVILVLMTLVYLAIQVKDAKDQVRRSVQQGRHSNLRELYLAPTQNADLASVCSKTEAICTLEMESEEQLFAAAGLSPQEIFVWRSHQRAWWTHWREVIGNRGQLSQTQLDEVNLGIKTIFSTTTSRIYLNSMGSIKSPTISYIQSVMNES